MLDGKLRQQAALRLIVSVQILGFWAIQDDEKGIHDLGIELRAGTLAQRL